MHKYTYPEDAFDFQRNPFSFSLNFAQLGKFTSVHMHPIGAARLHFSAAVLARAMSKTLIEQLSNLNF